MLEMSVLGPTEARILGESIPLAPLERNLLAVLALSTGTVISTERIIECLWGEHHPAAPRSRVQGLVSALRRKVGDALVTRHPGYLLDSRKTRMDLDECENLARQARLASSRDEAAQYLGKALDLWRGEPLDGVTAPGIEVDRVRLTELRVGLLEERFAVDLERGNHAELVAELAAVVATHPLRERLAGQLMLALYRCSRQADALRVYQSLRDRLADELGSDPGAELRSLHAAILRGDQPSLASVRRSRLRPAQLPASVGFFTGRDRELAALTSAVHRPSDEPRVLVVGGLGGLGKTALVVRWAHTVADLYPDGQLFVDLHGKSSPDALPADAALGAALAALGVVRAEIPASIDERAALYRTLLSGRRLLVVADDAASARQVLPLVPPTADSQLVVTSRRRLSALSAHHAVQQFPLDPLTPAATQELLGRIIGPGRVHDPAAATMVRWCGGWPLVVRLAAARLAGRPWQSLTSFVHELDDLADDLVLADDQRSVRAALTAAHGALSPAAAHLFGRFGLSDWPTVGLQLSASAADPAGRQIRRLLDELIAVHLVIEDGPDRYRVHDLVHRFARECGAELAGLDSVDEWMRHRNLVAAEHLADVHRI